MRFLLLLAACSSEPAFQAMPDLAPSECELLRQSLQAVADEKRTSPNATIALKNPACGTLVVVSGDESTATTESLWRIGSVTKTYVSATILTLFSEGKLGLDDLLSKWVADVPNSDGVTVRMLLNHTSGIFNYTEISAFHSDLQKVWTPRELVDFATANPPYFAPGSDFHYSNTNYILLGMVAELASGEKLGPLVRARTLDKAGLTHTFFDGEETIVGTLASGFSRSLKDATNAVHPSGPWAAGAMVASPADLAEWVAALYGSDQILGDAARAELTTTDNGYGLGVVLIPASASRGAGPSLGHTGGINGYVTAAFYFPEPDMSLVAIVNQDNADPNPLMAGALRVLYP
jgi:D-alanyl-D-alanine carboxypeptidase